MKSEAGCKPGRLVTDGSLSCVVLREECVRMALELPHVAAW